MVGLSADGNTLAVSAVGEDSAATGINGAEQNNSASNSGAVYVFVRSGNSWVQQAYIKASNTDAEDVFGTELSISANGDTLAVGARYESSNASGINGNQQNNSASESGAAYVFVRQNGNWTQHAYIKASNAEAGDHFGSSLDISADGTLLAVGAVDESSSARGINGDQNNNSASYSGAVYVYKRSGSSWTQQTYIKSSNAEERDYFGLGVRLADNGNLLAVGAFGEASSATGINGNESDNSTNRAGAVYVFSRSSGSWQQIAYLKSSNPDESDLFGHTTLAFSEDGSTLAVRSDQEDSAAVGINGNQNNNAAENSGAVYLY